MALSVTLTGTTVTLDETAGLQNDDTNTTLPTAFSSRLTALGADPATAINQAVSNGNVISISGVTGAIGNIAFTDANGGALNGDSSGLFTNDGEEIFLFTDTVNDNIVLGKTAAGAIAFAVFLEETGSPGSRAQIRATSAAPRPLPSPIPSMGRLERMTRQPLASRAPQRP